MNSSIEGAAGDVLQGKKGTKVKVVLFGWLKMPLRFKYVNASTFISISKVRSKMAPIDPERQVDAFVMDNARDMKHVSRMVALACLNGPVLNVLFARLLGMLLRWSSLDATEWQTMANLTKMHTNPAVFFYTMRSTDDLNLLKKTKTSTEEAKLSSVL